MGSKETAKWKNKNKEKVSAQKRRHRERHKKELNEINLIRLFAVRKLKPFLICKYGGCQLCKSTEKLEIHHIKYTNEWEDVMLLCRKCHLNIHTEGGVKKWKKKAQELQ